VWRGKLLHNAVDWRGEILKLGTLLGLDDILLLADEFLKVRKIHNNFDPSSFSVRYLRTLPFSRSDGIVSPSLLMVALMVSLYRSAEPYQGVERRLDDWYAVGWHVLIRADVSSRVVGNRRGGANRAGNEAVGAGIIEVAFVVASRAPDSSEGGRDPQTAVIRWRELEPSAALTADNGRASGS
jgi:hypothetical protein